MQLYPDKLCFPLHRETSHYSICFEGSVVELSEYLFLSGCSSAGERRVTAAKAGILSSNWSPGWRNVSLSWEFIRSGRKPWPEFEVKLWYFFKSNRIISSVDFGHLRLMIYLIVPGIPSWHLGWFKWQTTEQHKVNLFFHRLTLFTDKIFAVLCQRQSRCSSLCLTRIPGTSSRCLAALIPLQTDVGRAKNSLHTLLI